jgi:hypothetical protein
MPRATLKVVPSRRYRPPSREWRRLTVGGWQHGTVPEPPARVGEKSRRVWRLWFAGWVAAYWSPDDIPGLNMVLLAVEAAHRSGATARDRREAMSWMSSYGLTPKGRRRLRWLPPLTVVDDSSDG